MKDKATIKKKPEARHTKTIQKFGYMYYLVDCLESRKASNQPTPNFMDNPGYALRGCVKIGKNER